MKPVLMIHDFRVKYLKLRLQDYILTFDDGLISPIEFIGELDGINTEKIFFISTGIVGVGFEGRPSSDFLSVPEIISISKRPNTFIGGHSHSHQHLTEIKGLKNKADAIIKDTDKMMEWFNSNLNTKPDRFAFPFNESDEMYRAILKNVYGIKHIYGGERIDIESLFS